MASCAEGQGVREFLSDKVYQYYDKTTNLSSSTTASASSATEVKTASSEDLERQLSNTENKNTKRTTQTWVNGLIHGESREIAQELHKISPELDKILRFYAELMRSDGTDYEPEL